MELADIVKLYADGLAAADPVCAAPPAPRLPGVPSLTENEALREIHAYWSRVRPADTTAPNGHWLHHNYPTIRGAKCDHVFTTDSDPSAPEWAVELKRPQLVGDNGNNNDYYVTKMLSPLLKDRSVLHDAARLRHDPPARRLAVVGYFFTYNDASLEEAGRRHSPAYRNHPKHGDRLENIRAVVKKNGGELDPGPLIRVTDVVLRGRHFVRGDTAMANFDAWRHPCGGKGVVFGWEITNPADEHFDPRHPW